MQSNNKNEKEVLTSNNFRVGNLNNIPAENRWKNLIKYSYVFIYLLISTYTDFQKASKN